MRRTWLSSALPAGLRFGTRSFATRVNGLVVRPERQLQIEEFAKLFPLILSDDRIPPGLSKSRIRAGSNVIRLDQSLQGLCAQHYTVKVFTKTPGREYDLESLWHNVLARVQRPDFTALSLLQHLRVLTRESVLLWPSIDSALVGIAAEIVPGGSAWGLHFGLRHEGPLEHVDNEPIIVLQCKTNGGLKSKKGPNLATLGNSTWNVSFQLYMRLKPGFVDAETDQPSNRNHASNDTIKLAAEMLLSGLQQQLLRCTFTSNASSLEAAVQYLEREFSSTIFDRYCQLEQITARGGGVFVERNHKKSLQDAAETPNHVNRSVLLHEERSPEIWHAETGEQSHSLVHASQNSTKFVKMNIRLEGPATADLSVIARRFEERCAESAFEGLSSIVDGFNAGLRDTLPESADSLLCNVYNEDDLPKDHALVTDNCAQLARKPLRDIELRKKASTNIVIASITLRMHETFKIYFNNDKWDSCPVEVRQIVFQMTAVDGPSAVRIAAGGSLSLEQELNNLTTRALSILEKVCGNVRFDDLTMVPRMLAEALLRVVPPVTTTMKMEQVALSLVLGDDPLIITETITSEHLNTSEGGHTLLPHTQVELPPGTKLEIRHRHRWLEAKEYNTGRKGSRHLAMAKLDDTFRKTGVSAVSVSVFSSPNVEYELRKHGRDPIEALAAVWNTLLLGDLFNLQDLTRAAIGKIPESKRIHLDLRDGPRGARIRSDEDFTCLFSLPPLHAGFESFNQGKIAPVSIIVSLTGTLTQHPNATLCAGEQLRHMEEILVSRFISNIGNMVFRDDNDLAQVVGDKIYSGKRDLAEYLLVKTVHVGTSMHVKEFPTSSDRDGSATMGCERHGNPLGDPSKHELSAGGAVSVTASINGGEDAHQTEILSTAALENTQSAMLKDLMQKLDAQLSSFLASSLAQTPSASTSPHTAPLDTTAPPQSQMKRGVVVALGSNVGNRIEEIEKACCAIDADPDMRIVDTSFLYETKPMYVEDQERFMNGACEIETSLNPMELLDRLQAIEQGHGRVKLVDKGPRNIDLDIAIFRDEVVDSERLTIPHMLMHEREFVLRPIMDLQEMRSWKNPRTGIGLGAMYSQVAKASRDDMYTTTPLTAGNFVHTSIRTRQTQIMSILNTTPDSFSDGGSNALDPQSLRETAAAHISAGATIIDVGGQSSRPNAPDVTAEEEISRVLPAIAAIKSLPEAKGIAISVDTYRAAVAEAAVNAGADIVNDVSAGMMDPQMLPTVARLGCTYIMMHMRGTPATMQNPENCEYAGGLSVNIRRELLGRVEDALKAGVRKWRLVLDPGIGFAKTQEQNLALLSMNRRLFDREEFRERTKGMPWLVGSSRKGFIGRITGVDKPNDRAWGTAVAVTASIQGGADIVRVHDVKEMAQVAKMADALYRRPLTRSGQLDFEV